MSDMFSSNQRNFREIPAFRNFVFHAPVALRLATLMPFAISAFIRDGLEPARRNLINVIFIGRALS
jgi:hypothetical protein